MKIKFNKQIRYEFSQDAEYTEVIENELDHLGYLNTDLQLIYDIAFAIWNPLFNSICRNNLEVLNISLHKKLGEDEDWAEVGWFERRER